MNSTTNENSEQPTKPKTPAKFDLSDGIQKEDFIALGTSFLNLLKKILRFIFYPLIWVYNGFGNTFDLIWRSRVARPLTSEEVRYVKSWPILISTVGTALGLILGIIAVYFNPDEVRERIEDIESLFNWISDIISVVYDFLTLIFGTFYDLLIGLKDFILEDIFGTTDTLVPFIALVLIGYLATVILLIILESKFVAKLIDKISATIEWILNIPQMLYNYINIKIWNNIILNFSGKFAGGERLETHDNLYFKKVIGFSLGFSIFFFILGIFAFLNERGRQGSTLEDPVNAIIALIVILLVAGVISGFVMTPLMGKLFDKRKYLLQIPDELLAKTTISTTPSEEVSDVKGDDKTTPKTKISEEKIPPVKITKDMSAKERAMARRRAHRKANDNE